MPLKDNPEKLSADANEEWFREVVLPSLLRGVHKPDQPLFILNLGQAASGKSTAEKAAKERVGPAGALVADYDALVQFHPRYWDMVEANDPLAEKKAGDDAYAWVHKVIDFSLENGYNLIREGGEDPLGEALRAGAAGHIPEAEVMGVNEAISQLANYARFEKMLQESGHGRLASLKVHDWAYAEIPKVLDAMDEQRAVHSLRIHQRGGEVAYANSLDASGEWRRPPESRQKLEQARSQLLGTPLETWFRETYAHLEVALPDEHKAQLPRIAAVAERHGLVVGESAAQYVRIAGMGMPPGRTLGRKAAAAKPTEPERSSSGLPGPARPARPGQDTGAGRD